MYKTTKVVGLNSDQQAAQVLLLDQAPQTSFFVVLAATVEDAFSRCRQALFEVEQLFEERQSETTQINKILAESLEKVHESLKDAEDVSVVVVGLHDHAVYIRYQGKNIFTYLLRKSQFHELTSLAPEKELISGFLMDGDRVILTTSSARQVLDQDWPLLEEWSLEEIEDQMEARMPEAKVDPLAMIMVEFGQIQKVEAVVSETIPEAIVQEEVFTPQSFFKRFSGINWRSYIPKTKRGGLIVGGIFLGLVLLGTAYTYKHKKDVLVEAQFQQYYQKALNEYNQAQAFKDLDSVQAKQNLDASKSDLASALKVKPKDNQALDLQKQIDDHTGDILKVVQVKDLPVWLDLDLVKKNFFTQRISLSLGKVLVLDTNQKSLVEIDLEKKSNQILSGGDKLGNAITASLNGTSAYVLSQDKGVLKTDISSTNHDLTVAVKPDPNWSHLVDIVGFGGNVYVLDDMKGAVWKYVPTSSGFSDGRNYFTSTNNDIAGSLKMLIDSSVWILKADGTLYKYTQGVQDYFSFSGLDKPTKLPKSFYVSDDTNYVYILDTGNSRLLVTDKKGAYVTQYVSDNFKNFSDLVVDEKNKKAYLLSGQKIYQLSL